MRIVVADDLDVMIESAEGEGPSPAFVAALRERILAEASVSVSSINPPVEEISIRPVVAEASRRSWVMVAAAVAVAALAGVTVVRVDEDRGQVATVTRVEDSTNDPDGEELEAPREPTQFAPDAPRFVDSFTSIGPGTFRIDTLGTPFSIDFAGEYAVGPNAQAELVIAHPASEGSGDRTISFVRLTELSDPAAPIVRRGDRTGGWPAADIDGWLDNVSDTIVVSNQERTELGGLEALRIDLELGPVPCELGDQTCGWFGANHNLSSIELLPESLYRIWLVDQADEDPLAVVVAIDRAADRAWFEEAVDILSMLAFGETGANPVLRGASVGDADMDYLDGIRISFPPKALAIRDAAGFDRVDVIDWEASTEFLTRPMDRDGGVLESTEELLAALREVNVEPTVVGPDASVALNTRSVGGLEAQVFDVDGRGQLALTFAEGGDDGWPVPPRGRIWVIDHPERGLLVIAASAFENFDIAFPLIVGQTEAIVATLEFLENK